MKNGRSGSKCVTMIDTGRPTHGNSAQTRAKKSRVRSESMSMDPTSRPSAYPTLRLTRNVRRHPRPAKRWEEGRGKRAVDQQLAAGALYRIGHLFPPRLSACA